MLDQKLDIYQYDDYRKFLKDYYAHRKERDSSFSFRSFGRAAGLHTSNFLMLVINGKRNLSVETITKFAKALELTKDEAFYFKYLVMLNQSSDIDERQYYAEKLVRSKGFTSTHPLAQAQLHYLTKWYLVPIRELVGLPSFKENASWIAERLNNEISTEEAQKALEELSRLQLIKRDGSGKLVLNHVRISTGDEVFSALAAQFHRQMLKKAEEAISQVPREKREVSSVTLRVSQHNIEQIKDIVQRFRKEIVEVVNQEKQPDCIYQLNLQLFPLSKITESQDEEI